MLEIGILYSDFIQVWKPFSDVGDFKKDGVLVIVLTTERGNRKALCARMWNRANRYDVTEPWHGGDNYAIGVWGDYFFVDQWDDMDDHLHIRRTDDPHNLSVKQMNIPRPNRWPSDSTVMVFRGEWVLQDQWHDAIRIMDEEMF